MTCRLNGADPDEERKRGPQDLLWRPIGQDVPYWVAGDDHCTFNPEFGRRPCRRAWCRSHGQATRTKAAEALTAAMHGREGTVHSLATGAYVSPKLLGKARAVLLREVRRQLPGVEYILVPHFVKHIVDMHSVFLPTPTRGGCEAGLDQGSRRHRRDRAEQPSSELPAGVLLGGVDELPLPRP